MTRSAVVHPVAGDDRLFWLDGFLQPKQCGHVLDELQFAFWQPSTVSVLAYPGADSRTVYSPMRVSESTAEEWFTPDLHRTMRAVERRLTKLVPGMPGRHEPWQATRYFKGGKFDDHLDCGHWAHERAGERVHTVLIYLDTPRRGGSTRFPTLGVTVRARAGRVLVWRNLTFDMRCDPAMLHGSEPLVAGRKTVLVTWVRQRKVQRRPV